MIAFVLKLKSIYVCTILITSARILQSVTCIILLKVKVTLLVSAGKGTVALHVQFKTTALLVESTQLKREHCALRGHMQPCVWDTFSFFSLPPPPFFFTWSFSSWLIICPPLPHFYCLIILSHQSTLLCYFFALASLKIKDCVKQKP